MIEGEDFKVAENQEEAYWEQQVVAAETNLRQAKGAVIINEVILLTAKAEKEKTINKEE